MSQGVIPGNCIPHRIKTGLTSQIRLTPLRLYTWENLKRLALLKYWQISGPVQSLRHTIRIVKLARESRFFDIDDSTLKISGKVGRRFTQTIAAEIYGQGFDGIRYSSRLGSEYSCIAGFTALAAPNGIESTIIESIRSIQAISKDHPALVKVAKLFKLQIEDDS